VQCGAISCSVLQRDAVCCSVLLRSAKLYVFRGLLRKVTRYFRALLRKHFWRKDPRALKEARWGMRDFWRETLRRRSSIPASDLDFLNSHKPAPQLLYLLSLLSLLLFLSLLSLISLLSFLFLQKIFWDFVWKFSKDICAYCRLLSHGNVLLKEPYCLSKEPCLLKRAPSATRVPVIRWCFVKRALSSQKSPVCSKEPCLLKRALSSQNPFFSKEPCLLKRALYAQKISAHTVDCNKMQTTAAQCDRLRLISRHCPTM